MMPSWQATIVAFRHPRVITMLFLGISAGVPLLLIFSSLSLWLREAGVERSTVTYFSWAALGYSFKFVWAPLADMLSLPWLTRLLGRRRAWLLLSQLMIMLSISLMALTNPATDALTLMAWAAVLLGFSSATQDIAIDAYRIESADSNLQPLMASSYIAGYRIGMLIAGAGVLLLASYFGSTMAAYSYLAWQWSYLIMAAVMLIGVTTTLIIPEPAINKQAQLLCDQRQYAGILLLFVFSVAGFIASFYYSIELAQAARPVLSKALANGYLAGVLVDLSRLMIALVVATIIAKIIILSGLVQHKTVVTLYVAPVQDFFNRYGWSLAWTLLVLIGLYRISDIVLGVIANVFYQDIGFTKLEIARVVKSFGLAMIIAGGFIGGLLAVRLGVMAVLFLGAVLSALTNLLFVLLSYIGHDITMLYVVISADNLSAGLASAAFIAFLSSLTNISFTAVQYAIFSSLMTLLPKILGGYSGTLVDMIGYPQFFLATALMGLPVLLVIIWANTKCKLNDVSIK